MKQGYIMFEDKLNSEYKAAFEQVKMYSETHLIGEDVVDDMLMELLDHMLEAQEAGQPVSAVTGEDIYVFSKNFFSEYTARSRLHEIPGRIYKFAKIMFVLELVDLLILCEDKDGIMGVSDIGGFMMGFVFGILFDAIVFFLIRPLVDKKKNVKPAVVNGIINALFIIALVLACIFQYSLKVQRWIPLLLTSVYICIFMIIRAVKNYKTYGSLREPKKDTISFGEGLAESMPDELPKEWLKQYRRKNKRRARQGKDLITNEEFMEELDRRYDYKHQILENSVIMGSCALAAFIVTAISDRDSSESPMELVIFAFIELVIYCALWRFFMKSAKESNAIFHGMKEKMDAEGITLEEYVEGKENPEFTER